MLEITSIPLPYLAIAALLTAVAGLVQGTIGLGFAIVSVPLLSLVDPRLVPVPQMIASLPLSLWMMRREREDLDTKGVLWTTLGRVPGTLLGMWLLTVASQTVLDLTIGGIVLAGVGALSFGRAVPRNVGTELAAGAVSGAGAVVSAIGGPPIALLYKDDTGGTVRSSLAAIFTIGLFVTLLGRAASGHLTQLDWELGILLMAPTLTGLWGSRYLTGKVEGQPMRIAILLISGVAALALIGRATLG